GDDGAGLADAPGPVTGLVLDGRVPPAVVEHDVTRRREVEARTAGLERQHESPRAVGRLELLDELVPGPPRQTAVVARHRHARAGGEVAGQLLAPLGEVGEHEDLLAG